MVKFPKCTHYCASRHNDAHVDAVARDIPMGLQKALPGSLSPSIWCRIDAVVSEDGADGGIGDLVAEVCQGALDAVIAPDFPGP